MAQGARALKVARRLHQLPARLAAAADNGLEWQHQRRWGGGRDCRKAPPVPSIFESESQNRHHHSQGSHTNPGSTIDSINEDSLHHSAGGNGSFKGVLTGGSSNQTSRTVSWDSSSYFSTGMWDDPVIVAARIPLDKIVVEALISRGGYAEVYRGTYHNKQIALKRLLPDMRKDLREIEKFLSEAKLMASLEHVHIVKFVGVGWDSLADLCVVFEFMVGGDLRSLLHAFEHERTHGFDRDKVIIALHVAHAITYLHSLDPIVLHRDLKSKNILLDDKMNAKVMDFGVSREQSDRTLTVGVGTLLWMAPEVMVDEKYDEKADVFSFGVVLSELDTHAMPYAHAKMYATTGRKVPDTAIIQIVSSGKLRVQFSEPSEESPLSLETASDLEKLCKACVAFDARDRPTAAEVLYQLQRVLRAFDDADEILAELRAGL